jgi:hypothetical protein
MHLLLCVDQPLDRLPRQCLELPEVVREIREGRREQLAVIRWTTVGKSIQEGHALRSSARVVSLGRHANMTGRPPPRFPESRS